MTLTRRIHLATIALAALTFSIGIAEPARATSARSTLAPTGADPDASGRAVMRAKRKKGALQGQLLVTAKKVDAGAEFEVTIDGVRVGTLTANRRGSARARFRTSPRGADQLLGVDPRGRALAILRSGAVVLAGVLPDDSSTAGDVRCCLPDDSGPECEDRTAAECAAAGGIDLGPGSCLPNPCSGGPASDDVVCCLPDDSGPECEDRTAAQCASEGGVRVDGASCAAATCAPTPPPDGDVRCCLPDDSGPECEDRTAAECAAGGGVNLGVGSCVPNPCLGGGGTTTTLPSAPLVRVTCEKRNDRSRVSVNGHEPRRRELPRPDRVGRELGDQQPGAHDRRRGRARLRQRSRRHRGRRDADPGRIHRRSAASSDGRAPRRRRCGRGLGNRDLRGQVARARNIAPITPSESPRAIRIVRKHIARDRTRPRFRYAFPNLRPNTGKVELSRWPRACIDTGMANTQRLSPLDASFLYYEKPNRRLHVGCVAMLDGTIPFGSFVEAMADRLGRIARYHQRPVRSFLDLRWPNWEDDPSFDVRHHVRHVGVPAPGDDATFHALVDTLFATALDPERPLWETYLIDGLAGGRSAVLCKIHHAMIDGVSGAQILEVMSDPVSSPAGAGGPVRRAAADGGARAPLRSMLHPAALLEQAGDALRAIGTLATFVREPGSTLPFNAPITDARRIVWASFPLDDFLTARGVAECKVNDVVLAVVAGALRRWLIGRGITTDGLCVRTLVPMSTRGAEHHLALGNLVTAMVARLPIDVADPRERLRRVTAEMRTLKEAGQQRATGLALQLASWLPPAVHAVIARLAPPVVPLNTVTTNVPGPREAGRLLGRRIDEVHPIVPLYDGMGIEFAIMSYADRLSICAVADPHLVPEAAELEAHLHAAADELAEALGLHEAPAVPATATPMRVADLMTTSVVAVAGTDSLETAWQLMRTRGVRHLPVVALDGHLVGLITHRDLLAASPSSLLTSLDRVAALRASARVADVMETRLSVAAPDESAGVAGNRMLRHKIGCLPVVDAGRLVGIVTGDDFLRWATMRLLPTATTAAAVAQPAIAAAG